MPVTAGKRIGSYEILSAIGKGGMGEVCRARDTRLDRDVAIKTLPEEFEEDTNRPVRFEREATPLASLNHPNIGAICRLEKYDGSHVLGKGGMGEVYRVNDRKLGRDGRDQNFAAQDADRFARFQREAKLLASLNHPNIDAIHGSQYANDVHFLVLELVEGETLSDQLTRGPMPVDESLRIAVRIAEALQAEHEKDLIHRDLKPANIKITQDGTVKVLDFGLAKAGELESSEADTRNSSKEARPTWPCF